MAPMKLAEFRYGREEMLALYDEVRHDEKDPPDEYAFLKQMTLWLAKPQTPLNKQVRSSFVFAATVERCIKFAFAQMFEQT